MPRELILVPVGDDVKRLTVAEERDGRNIPCSVLNITYEGNTPFAAFADDKDAQLFVAAPDLLTALEGLVAIKNTYTHDDDCRPSRGIHSESCLKKKQALELARAAIAKAKGEV